MKLPRLFLGIVLVGATAALVHAHCEIPCGIYADRTRIDLLYEDVATIEKSMQQIQELSAKLKGGVDPLDANQLTRWIANKDDHATALQDKVTQYFMTQRVKPAQGEARDKYLAQLTALHEMLVSAMKCKQTVDLKHVADLRAQIDRFAAAYFSEEDLKHIREHHAGGK